MQAGWIERAAWLVLACLLLAAGCKVDASSNPNHFCTHDSDCTNAGRPQCYHGFCVEHGSSTGGNGGKPDSGKQDGGTSPGEDAGRKDGAVGAGDAGDAGEDASIPIMDDVKIGTSCALDAGDFENCYLGPRGTQVKGVCRAGIRTCDCPGGAQMCDQHIWGDCFNQIVPSPELCNGLDDDCDDAVDDRVVAGSSCVIDGAKGVCAEGVDACDDGVPVCVQNVEASAETCDGKDNDCDDEVDEDTERACYPDATAGCVQDPVDGSFACKGPCAPGVQLCDKGEYGACNGDGLVTPKAEVCTEVGEPAVNENCDDKTDEGCDCPNGTMYPCYDGPPGTAGKGRCTAGMQLCTNHELGDCEGQLLPREETCANDTGTPQGDDDCDTEPDNVPHRDEACFVPSKKGLCRSGTQQCEGNELVCVTPEAVDEICDGLDNDCDGTIDNGFNLQTDSNHCGTCDTVCGPGTVCCAGHCANTQTDARYCGSCGNRCSAGGICCSGACKNASSDAHNCKTCGNDCTLLGLLGACCSGTCKTLGCGGG